MTRLICPPCGEPVEVGRPRDYGYPSVGVEPRRLEHRHAGDRTGLCPVMTSSGYQPAMPVQARA